MSAADPEPIEKSTVEFDGRTYIPVFAEVNGRTTFELVTKDGGVPLVRQLIIDRLFRLESAEGATLKRLERAVSELSDLIAETKVEFLAAVDRVKNDVGALDAKIVELQAKVDAGGASKQDIADLRELKAIASGLNPTKPDVLPGPPPTPTPTPEPPPDVEEVPTP